VHTSLGCGRSNSEESCLSTAENADIGPSAAEQHHRVLDAITAADARPLAADAWLPI
jgi:hypothetical protein